MTEKNYDVVLIAEQPKGEEKEGNDTYVVFGETDKFGSLSQMSNKLPSLQRARDFSKKHSYTKCSIYKLIEEA
jgi:hypothetical protein